MSKKKGGKFALKQKKSHKGLVTVLVAAVLILLALAAVMLREKPQADAEPAQTEDPAAATRETAAAEATAPATVPEDKTIDLGYGICITDMGSYTGMFMEDGTNEILSGIFMLVVENTGDQDIQYAQITMDLGGQEAQFSLSTLPVGEKMVLLEANRMQWEDSIKDSAALPKIQNVAFFQEPISTMADKLDISIVDGAINVTNISGKDIPGIIAVYYKNAAADIYYGGITYRIQIKDGLKAGEIRQVMTNHASDTGSEIMFVTISE